MLTTTPNHQPTVASLRASGPDHGMFKRKSHVTVRHVSDMRGREIADNMLTVFLTGVQLEER